MCGLNLLNVCIIGYALKCHPILFIHVILFNIFFNDTKLLEEQVMCMVIRDTFSSGLFPIVFGIGPSNTLELCPIFSLLRYSGRLCLSPL